MSLFDTVRLYLQYDEDSLATYANVGLVRRAKKSLEAVTLLATEPQPTFSMEEATITLPAGGLTKATCDCSVHGACKHIVTCILWLQQNADTVQGLSSQSVAKNTPVANDLPISPDLPILNENPTPKLADSPANTTTANPISQATSQSLSALENVLNFDSLAILKTLKKAERLLAYQLFCDWQTSPEAVHFDITPQKIRITMPLSDTPITYVAGADFEGLLSDIPQKYQRAAHVAVVALLFFQNQKTWLWSDDIQTHIADNANSENANSENANTFHSLSLADKALISQLQQHCLDILSQGLSHLAKEQVVAIHLLNMQARTQHLPRLAGELRGLHGVLQRLLAGDVQTDEAVAFVAVAQFYAYLFALSQINSKSDMPKPAISQLVGQVRREYEDTTLEQLIPLGADWWQLPSGARGLTVCFWDVTAGRLCEVTAARANSLDRTFDRQSVAQTGIWGSSLAFLLQHSLRLTHAKFSENFATNQVLSPSPDTRFITVNPLKDISIADFEQNVGGISDWQQLEQLLLADSAITLRRPRYVLLQLGDTDTATNTTQNTSDLELNELNQSFDCWIRDKNGRQLQLSLPLSNVGESRRVRVDKLQTLIKTRHIIAILVNIDYQAQQPRFIPCSVVLAEKRQEKGQTSVGIQVFSLDYDHIATPKKGLFELLSQRIQRMYDKKQLAMPPISVSEQLLTLLQARLDYYASSGKSQFDPQDSEQLMAYFQQCEALGLTVLASYGKKGMAQLADNQTAQTAHNSQNPQITMPHFLLQLRFLLATLQQMAVRLPIQ